MLSKKNSEGTENKPNNEKSIEELAQAVKDNEARVEQQRKDIYFEKFQLKDKLNKPIESKANELESFDASKIEASVKQGESYESMRLKIHAIDIALEHPACCDKDLLNAIHEYLQVVRPLIEKLETEQWNKVKQIEEIAQRYHTLNHEYDELEKNIFELLHVVHLPCRSRDYEKRGYNGGSNPNSYSVISLIDDALKRCDSGESYNVLARYPITYSSI